jgi:hypothetical protein
LDGSRENRKLLNHKWKLNRTPHKMALKCEVGSRLTDIAYLKFHMEILGGSSNSQQGTLNVCAHIQKRV